MSQRPYELSAAARLDILDIWNYLADQASLDVADKVLAELEAAMDRLARSPGMGHPRPDLTDRHILFYAVHSYLIVFRPDTRPLQVLRVVHAARDVKSMLTQ